MPFAPHAGVTPRNRSLRRRSISTVASSPIEITTSIVATARMAGLIASRIPFHICLGIVCSSFRPTKSTTTTSSNEVTKANRAPDTIPGVIKGMITLKNVVVGEAPSDADARVSEWSNPSKVAVTVMITKGIPSVAWARITPR